MKKIIHKGQLTEIHKRPSKQGQIVLFRAGKDLYVENLELPSDSRIILVDDNILIKIPFRDGDFLVIQDEAGIEPKRKIE